MFFLLASVQLIPDGTLFIHIALILLMIWILNRTFFRPVNRIIETREKNKGGKFTEAENLLREVGDKQTRYNEAMRDARAAGHQMIEQERAEAAETRERAVAQTKEETAGTLSAERDSIMRQIAEAKTALAAESDKMADQISANILKA